MATQETIYGYPVAYAAELVGGPHDGLRPPVSHVDSAYVVIELHFVCEFTTLAPFVAGTRPTAATVYHRDGLTKEERLRYRFQGYLNPPT